VGGTNNYASLNSPSFSGAVGIGQAAPTPPTLLALTDNTNANVSQSTLNNSTGTAAQALFSWSNGTNQLYVGIDGTGFTAPAGQSNAQGPNSSVILSTAANGLYIGSLTAHGVTRFFSADGSSNSTAEGYFDDTGWHLPVLTLTNNGHLGFQHGTLPTATSCGTSPTVTSTSGDAVGDVAVGTGGSTTCTITFATGFTSATCTCTAHSAGITCASVTIPSTTNISMAFSAPVAAGQYASWQCLDKS
jgi:hypothetical protein